MLVGDLIIGTREMIPDILPLGTAAIPGAELLAAQGGAAGVTLPTSATYRVKLTYQNGFGETLPGAESAAISVDGTHGITISAPGAIPPGIVNVVAYLGIGVNGENQQVTIPVTSLPHTIIAPGYPAAVPTRNTAYLPDSDGGFLSAQTIYRWLNEALNAAARLCGGGIPDLSGVPTISGNPNYILTGNWGKMDHCWYDGWPVFLGRRDDIYRRSPIGSNVVGVIVPEYQADRVMMDMWPQPSRTAGLTTTTGAITASAAGGTVVSLTDFSAFVLTFGLGLLGTEIVSYYNGDGVANQITIAVRGLGGTVAQAWPSGTAFQELNLMFTGLRVPSNYNKGDGFKTLPVPFGWETLLKSYVVGQYLMVSKRFREGETEVKRFEQGVMSWSRMVRQFAGPRQIQAGGARGLETYNGLGSPFGGVIVP